MAWAIRNNPFVQIIQLPSSTYDVTFETTSITETCAMSFQRYLNSLFLGWLRNLVILPTYLSSNFIVNFQFSIMSLPCKIPLLVNDIIVSVRESELYSEPHS